MVAKAESLKSEDMEEVRGANNGGSSGQGNKAIEKPLQLICGGLEKRFVF
jgi:hypothetical protein